MHNTFLRGNNIFALLSSWVEKYLSCSYHSIIHRMAADHRVIGLSTDKVLCIPATWLIEDHANASVNTKVLFTDANGTEFRQGRLLFIGGTSSCLWVVPLKLAFVFHTARTACIREISRIMTSMGNDEFRLSKWILQFQLAQKQDRCSRSSTSASRATRMVDLAQPRQQQVIPRPSQTAQIPEPIPVCGK